MRFKDYGFGLRTWGIIATFAGMAKKVELAYIKLEGVGFRV